VAFPGGLARGDKAGVVAACVAGAFEGNFKYVGCCRFEVTHIYNITYYHMTMHKTIILLVFVVAAFSSCDYRFYAVNGSCAICDITCL
jgi:hypothetical protein